MVVVDILTGELLGGLVPEGNTIDVVHYAAVGDQQISYVRVIAESVRDRLTIGVSGEENKINKIVTTKTFSKDSRYLISKLL